MPEERIGFLQEQKIPMNRQQKIEQMLLEAPDDVFLIYSLAMELAKADLAAARVQFARIRDIDPNYVPAYFQEGQLLAGHDLPADAKAILQQGIETARRTGDSHALGEMTEFLQGLDY